MIDSICLTWDCTVSSDLFCTVSSDLFVQIRRIVTDHLILDFLTYNFSRLLSHVYCTIFTIFILGVVNEKKPHCKSLELNVVYIQIFILVNLRKAP